MRSSKASAFGFALYSVCTLQASGNVLVKIDDRGRGGNLIETAAQIADQFSEMGKAKIPRGTPSPCTINGVETLCIQDDLTFFAVNAVPAIPMNLFKLIQNGKITKGTTVEYRREAFWNNIRRFNLDRSLGFIDQMHQGLNDVVWWVGTHRDQDAAELSRVWNQVFVKAKQESFSSQGFFVAEVRHSHPNLTRSWQLCWIFSELEDASRYSCMSVVVEWQQRTFVRFVKGYAEFGHAFEPENYFVCLAQRQSSLRESLVAIARNLAAKFANGPYHLGLNTQRIDGESAGRLRLMRKFEPSEIFPGFREVVDVRLSFNRTVKDVDKGTYHLDLGYTFAISKQNVGELSEITLPSDVQLDFYNKRIVQFTEANLACKKTSLWDAQ